MVKFVHTILKPGLFFLLLMTTAAQADAATITATVDRSQVTAGESIQLRLEVKGDSDGEPDFSPLENDFDILSRNQQNMMQIINGRRTSKRQWVLNLMPKHDGALTIPAVAFGRDRSNALKVVVKPAPISKTGTAKEDIFLQVSAEPNDAHVQAQVLYTIRVYIGRNVGSASLSEPTLSDADAVIKKLGDDHQFETQHQGRRYQVVERRYAIFPQQSGKLTIKPVIFNAELAQPSHFRGGPFAQFGQNKRLRSEAVEINIKHKPVSEKNKIWLPARAIKLQEAWPQDPPTFKVGEAVTRTVTLIADGLTAAQLPEIIKQTPKEFKAYPDQAALDDQIQANGIRGVRQEKIALIATKAGHYLLPAVTVHWWNTQTQRRETARIAERKIEVLVAPASILTPTNTQPGDVALANNNKPIVIDSTSPTQNTETKPGFWPWLTALLALGWFATLLFMWFRPATNRTSTDKNNTAQTDERHLTRQQAEKKIKQACQKNNVQAAKAALLLWGNSLYPENKLGSISELANHIGGPVAEHINTLNRVLYSQSQTDWQGQALWESIQHYNTAQQITSSVKETLAPLYP